MATTQKSDHRELRAHLKSWLQSVMDRKSWSAERWARGAQTSPTNITRLLSGRSPYIPSMSTLTKLAAAAGGPMPPLGFEATPTRCVARLTVEELKGMYRDRDLEILSRAELRGSDVFVPAATPKSYAAVTVELDSMSAVGIGPGDTLVIDALAPAAHGQIVCALYDGKVGAFIYAPPYALPQSVNAAWRPLPIDQMSVVGVVKQQIRTFA